MSLHQLLRPHSSKTALCYTGKVVPPISAATLAKELNSHDIDSDTNMCIPPHLTQYRLPPTIQQAGIRYTTGIQGLSPSLEAVSSQKGRVSGNTRLIGLIKASLDCLFTPWQRFYRALGVFGCLMAVQDKVQAFYFCAIA